MHCPVHSFYLQSSLTYSAIFVTLKGLFIIFFYLRNAQLVCLFLFSPVSIEETVGQQSVWCLWHTDEKIVYVLNRRN